MEKVTLPKEVAEALESLKADGLSNLRIAADALTAHVVRGTDYFTLRMFLSESNENDDILLSALVNGYEVEMTPEEQIRELYEEAKDNYHSKTSLDRWGEGYAEGVLNTVENILDILGIEVEGINA